MPAVILLLAVVVLVIALVILGVDARRRRAAHHEPQGLPVADAPRVESEPVHEDGAIGAVDEDSGEDTEVTDAELEGEPEDLGEGEPLAPLEPEPADEPAAPEDSAARRGWQEKAGLTMPGSLRRQRRSWAREHGFDFAKSDPYLTAEFAVGAGGTVSTQVRDVVSGVIQLQDKATGHEIYFFDLASTSCMAMRRAAESDVQVEFHRPGTPAMITVLEHYGDVSGWQTESNDLSATARFIDSRVTTALAQLPESVETVWLERGWVLAALARGSKREEWDDLIIPLTLLSDAGRVLPPRFTQSGALYSPGEDADPTRLLPQPPVGIDEAENELDADADADVDAVERPVIRPEEPVELPSRRTAESHGVLNHSPLGVDEVASIADGTVTGDQGQGAAAPAPKSATPRISRKLAGESSIFTDADPEEDPIDDDEHRPRGRHSAD